jgi:hypothetical protein
LYHGHQPKNQFNLLSCEQSRKIKLREAKILVVLLYISAKTINIVKGGARKTISLQGLGPLPAPLSPSLLLGEVLRYNLYYSITHSLK